MRPQGLLMEMANHGWTLSIQMPWPPWMDLGCRQQVARQGIESRNIEVLDNSGLLYHDQDLGGIRNLSPNRLWLAPPTTVVEDCLKGLTEGVRLAGDTPGRVQ
jgi:hypothetical protein